MAGKIRRRGQGELETLEPQQDNGEEAASVERITIPAPNFAEILLRIEGDGKPYVQHRFSEKARGGLKNKHEAGSTAGKGTKREKRNFKKDYEGAFYRGPKGEQGIPAMSIKAAMVGACRLVGFKMTLAKMGIFVEPEFHDPRDGTGLIPLTGKPRSHTKCIMPVRNSGPNSPVDLRVRPMWDTWKSKVRIKYDQDIFERKDIINLLLRAGIQCGIGEGRPDSKKSIGMGWGTFRVLPQGKGTR